MSKISKIGKKIEKGISDIIPHQHSADKRSANQLVKDQLDYYQEAKATMHADADRVAGEKKAEQQKIHEKQIRALRRNFRSSGFLGTQPSSETSETLG